jgi:hypothetical protein
MDVKTDHDLLIELNTRVNLWHSEIMRVMEGHVKDDTEQFSLVRTNTAAAHRRLDGIFSLKDKVLGGAAVAGFLFAAIVSVAAIIFH